MATNKLSNDFALRSVELAERSRFKGFGTGAVIVRKNKIVSEGWSHMSSVRLKQLWSLHAEIHALGRCRHLDFIPSSAVIYIATIRKTTHTITFGKPCLTCAIALRSAGIGIAYHSEPDGTFSMLDLESDLSALKVYPPNGVQAD